MGSAILCSQDFGAEAQKSNQQMNRITLSCNSSDLLHFKVKYYKLPVKEGLSDDLSVESFKTQFNCFLSISSIAAVGQNLIGLGRDCMGTITTLLF